MIYLGVNLTYPLESGLPIFRGWGMVALHCIPAGVNGGTSDPFKHATYYIGSQIITSVDYRRVANYKHFTGAMTKLA